MLSKLNKLTKINAEKIVREHFEAADIGLDGKRPTDIKVHNHGFYGRLLRDSSLGLGESYMDGWWDCEELDGMVAKATLGALKNKMPGDWRNRAENARAFVLNLQNRARAPEVAHVHYDLGNDLYEAMLDPRMLYTCGYWPKASNLDEAQEHKIDLICRKLGLKEGMTMLDLGCGWGGLAAWAAEKYGVRALGISISKEQVAWAKNHWRNLPVEFHLGDYRDATGVYDRVVSVGMMEHVGHRNHRTFMEVVHRCMKDDGVALVHTIGSNISRYRTYGFVDRYIFPNVCAPSVSQVTKAMEGLLMLEDVHNIGPDYDPTLVAWWNNFDAAWPELKSHKLDERFYRMWKFYLLGAAGLSRARDGHLWHFVMTKHGRKQPHCRLS